MTFSFENTVFSPAGVLSFPSFVHPIKGFFFGAASSIVSTFMSGNKTTSKLKDLKDL